MDQASWVCGSEYSVVMDRALQQLTQADVAEMNIFGFVDVSVGDVDCTYALRTPLFSNTGYGHIVQVNLVHGWRPTLQWTFDESHMFNQFDAADSHTLSNGEYVLDSNHPFVLHIENGKPYRPDFIRHDWRNRAYCCTDARAFILTDPTKDKTSTYVQVSNDLIIEVSHNRNGCVHLWRRRQP